MNHMDQLLSGLLDIEYELTTRLSAAEHPDEQHIIANLRTRTAMVRQALQARSLHGAEPHYLALVSVEEVLNYFRTSAALEKVVHAVDRALYFSDPTTDPNE